MLLRLRGLPRCLHIRRLFFGGQVAGSHFPAAARPLVHISRSASSDPAINGVRIPLSSSRRSARPPANRLDRRLPHAPVDHTQVRQAQFNLRMRWPLQASVPG
jgi:hypothetical protein